MASYATRRKPRRVARQEDDEIEDDGEPVVRRPNTSGPKQKTKLRMSFAPEDTPDTSSYDEQEANSGPTSRLGASKSTQQSSLRASLAEKLPLRAANQEDRPAYNQDYLAELRTSTPSKPRSPAASDDNNAVQSVADQTSTLQTFEGGGIGSTLIPSATEIAEKKERRARLAKEQDYIALDDDEQDWRITLDKAEKDTRLVRDDEDFAEGFEEFVDDGIVALGKRAEKDRARKDRAHMQELIDNAEESSEDESEVERNFAYEEAQTRAGMDGMNREVQDRSSAYKMPPTVTKISQLSTVMEKLRARLQEMEQRSNLIAKQRQALHQEKTEIEAREKEIQALVTEAGEKYEKARLEAGLGNETPSSVAVISAAQTPDAMIESG